MALAAVQQKLNPPVQQGYSAEAKPYLEQLHQLISSDAPVVSALFLKELAENLKLKPVRNMTGLPAELLSQVAQFLIAETETPALTLMAFQREASSTRKLLFSYYRTKYEMPVKEVRAILSSLKINLDVLQGAPHEQYAELLQLVEKHKEELFNSLRHFCKDSLEDFVIILLTSKKVEEVENSLDDDIMMDDLPDHKLSWKIASALAQASQNGEGKTVARLLQIRDIRFLHPEQLSHVLHFVGSRGDVNIFIQFLNLFKTPFVGDSIEKRNRILQAWQKALGLCLAKAVAFGHIDLVNRILQLETISDDLRKQAARSAASEGCVSMVETLLESETISDDYRKWAVNHATQKKRAALAQGLHDPDQPCVIS